MSGREFPAKQQRVSQSELCLEVGLETPEKRTETRGKRLLQNFTLSRNGVENVWKQDRDEEHKKTTLLLWNDEEKKDKKTTYPRSAAYTVCIG